MSDMQQNEDGTWSPAIPLPMYYGLVPWAWKRLTGWRDEYGRKAEMYSWLSDRNPYWWQIWLRKWMKPLKREVNISKDQTHE